MTTISDLYSTFASNVYWSHGDTGVVSVTNPNQFTCDSVHTITTTLLPSDSTFAAGYFSLPIIIQYSSNILSYEETLRENRYLEFFFTNSKDKTKATYKSTTLIKRIGYPVKSQFFWKVPFTTIAEEKIYRQDSTDLYDFLNKQFEVAKRELGANKKN